MKIIAYSFFLFLLTSCSSADKTSPTPEPSSEQTLKASTPPLIERYKSIMAHFPPEEKIHSCHSVNYRSHKKLRRNVRNIYLNNPQVAIPNYNGIYLILESPVNEGSQWFLINCRTGRYVTSVPTTDEIMFNADSRIIVTRPFDDSDSLKKNVASEFIEWRDKKWITIEDPLLPVKE